MKYNIAEDLLVKGVNCWVRVGKSPNDVSTVGFVDSFSATKNVTLQEANVCGSIVPASIDAQGLRVSLSLSGFLASKSTYEGETAYNGKGKVSICSFNPKSEDFITSKVVTKFEYMDFYDAKQQKVIASFDWAMPESFSMQFNGGAYTKANVSMRAIDMSCGSDYIPSDALDQINGSSATATGTGA